MYTLPCPNCGSELAFLEQYGRHYCYACGRYAPEGYGDRGAMSCPTCAGVLSYVAQYDRYYCYRCNAYPPDDGILASRLQPTPSEATSADRASSLAIAEPVAPVETWTTTSEPPLEPEQKSERRIEQEIPQDETTGVASRRPLDREELHTAKKPLLMDLCKEYNLDPTGTREQLRERLLSYLDELEAENEPEETRVAEEGRPEPETVHIPSLFPIASEPTGSMEERDLQAAEEPERSEPVYSAPYRATSSNVMARPADQSQELTATPVVVTVPESQAVAAETPQVEAGRLVHPCPRCGRELTYIAQYNRWYCYRCRAYAPRARSKFACPSCGATMRWISQYERWWCDACRRYAPIDLPRPASAGAGGQARVASATITHGHRSPGSGIGLVGFGIFLFLLYEVFVDLPSVLSYSTGIRIAPDIAFGLRFFAFVFVALGAIAGLSAVRHRS